MQVENSVAPIVGGASGMAKATAEDLSALGAKVAILDLESSTGESVAQSLPGEAIFCPMNILDSDSIGSALDKVVDAFGALHIGVNTAGGGIAGRTLSRKGAYSIEDYRKVIELNLIGAFDFLRQAAERMAKNEPNADQERGIIINTASIAAYEGQIGQVAYAAAKAGITGMAFVAARDLGSMGIRSMAIAPSLFLTGRTEGITDDMAEALTKDAAFPKRMGQPDEYARLVRSIVENPMLNGSTIRLDGGQRFAPK